MSQKPDKNGRVHINVSVETYEALISVQKLFKEKTGVKATFETIVGKLVEIGAKNWDLLS